MVDLRHLQGNHGNGNHWWQVICLYVDALFDRNGKIIYIEPQRVSLGLGKQEDF
jgi:hypothetical protein